MAEMSKARDASSKHVQLKCILDGGLRPELPIAGGYWGVGAKPPVAGQFFGIFLEKKLF